jgi:uncharacterized membrane protein ArfC
MSHVHWALLAVSFALGTVVTFVLTMRSVKRHAPVGTSGDESEPATTLIPVETEPPTTLIPAETEPPTTQIPVETEPPTAQIPAANRPPRKRPPGAKGSRTGKIAVVPYAPFGPGSARADARGHGPSGWMVKGRSDTRLYYTPDDATYDRTIAQVWFRDEDSAVRAYFTPWRKSSKK